MNIKKLVFVIFVIAIAFMIFFIVVKFSGQKTILETKEEKLLKLVDSLIENLNSNIKSVKIGDTSSVEENLNRYAEQFDKFVLESNKSIKDLDESSLVNLREKEWENYSLFLELKKEIEPYPQFKEQIEDIETAIESRLTQQFLEATEKLIFNNPKQLNYKGNKLLAVIGDFYHQIMSIKVEEKGVIHKKVVCESVKDGSGDSYEAWIDIETGDIRQELQAPYGKEINITSGKTQRKLALDVDNKLAEWIDKGSGKVGIMSEGVDDPHTQFKNKLTEENCWLDGTDIVNVEQTYVLKCPIYDKDYILYYISATSYFPLREMTFYEIILSEPTVIKTGEVELIMDCWFTIAEIIDRESLPDYIFDQKIPDGYRIEDWVPIG